MSDVLAEVEAELADKIFAYLKRESVPEYANRVPVEGYAWLTADGALQLKLRTEKGRECILQVPHQDLRGNPGPRRPTRC